MRICVKAELIISGKALVVYDERITEEYPEDVIPEIIDDIKRSFYDKSDYIFTDQEEKEVHVRFEEVQAMIIKKSARLIG